MQNPFNPGAGRKPPYLAGRDKIIASLKNDMKRVYRNDEGARPIIISGLRGMGKTVLLRELVNYAKQNGWLVIWAEASNGDSLAKKLARSMHSELRRIQRLVDPTDSIFKHALSVLKSFQLKVDPSGSYSFGIDIEPLRGYADSGDLSIDLADLFQAVGEAAREAGTAVFIGIDEIQEAPSEDLTALNVALHSIGQDASPVPIYFAGAGLPTLAAVLADATSYAERMYRYYSLDLLDEKSVVDAYVEPSEASGISWEPEALHLAVEAAGGYPYFIQQCGYCICEEALNESHISKDLAQLGIELARDEVDRGLYKSRWDRATPKGRELMQAMAELGTPTKLSDLAEKMNYKKTSSLSVARNRLIRDGLAYSPERGCLAFTVPGMGSYILRNI